MYTGITMKFIFRKVPSSLTRHTEWHTGKYVSCAVEGITKQKCHHFIEQRVNVELTRDYNGFPMQIKHFSFDPKL
jgi:hypothetical protein